MKKVRYVWESDEWRSKLEHVTRGVYRYDEWWILREKCRRWIALVPYVEGDGRVHEITYARRLIDIVRKIDRLNGR